MGLEDLLRNCSEEMAMVCSSRVASKNFRCASAACSLTSPDHRPEKTSRHPACKWTQRLTGGKSSRRHSSALKHGQMASFRRSMAQSPIDGACDDDDDHYYILLLSLLQF